MERNCDRKIQGGLHAASERRLTAQNCLSAMVPRFLINEGMKQEVECADNLVAKAGKNCIGASQNENA
jgi:hypothetical protein